jgi:hypothetical protein
VENFKREIRNAAGGVCQVGALDCALRWTGKLINAYDSGETDKLKEVATHQMAEKLGLDVKRRQMSAPNLKLAWSSSKLKAKIVGFSCTEFKKDISGAAVYATQAVFAVSSIPVSQSGPDCRCR